MITFHIKEIQCKNLITVSDASVVINIKHRHELEKVGVVGQR